MYYIRHPPKCARFNPQREPERGAQYWDLALETKNFMGYLIYDLDELHWKPKTEKIDKYFSNTSADPVGDEEWAKRRSEQKVELEELRIKCKDWWHYEVLGWKHDDGGRT